MTFTFLRVSNYHKRVCSVEYLFDITHIKYFYEVFRNTYSSNFSEADFDMLS